ncbi:MAG: CBS domain-containing protein [Candidatus Hydrothermarchaeales archaeon]
MYRVPEFRELRNLRLKLGLTQTELAKRAKISQPLIARIEAGNVDPRTSTLKKILNVLQENKHGKGLTAADVMKAPVVHARPEDTIGHASKLMESYGISQLPVLMEGIQTGSISEARIVEELTRERDYSKVSSKNVAELMGEGFPTISPHMDLETLSQLVGSYPAVLVVQKGKVMGIVTKADLLKLTEE